MYAFIDYTWNIFVINFPMYACKWTFLVQARFSWALCSWEPRAYSTSAVLPLPFVNMHPSKLLTIYTCIMLAAEQLKKCGWYCIIIKFDLPLEKTREMVLVEGQLTLLPVVNIRLGGFHYLLSSTGSIGTDSSSITCTFIHHLKEIIICKEQCCSHDTWRMVVHILKAPAYICYLREHWQHCYRRCPLYMTVYKCIKTHFVPLLGNKPWVLHCATFWEVLVCHMDRHNYGAGAHVKTARDVTHRGHGISLSNQAEPAQPIWMMIAFSRVSCE